MFRFSTTVNVSFVTLLNWIINNRHKDFPSLCNYYAIPTVTCVMGSRPLLIMPSDVQSIQINLKNTVKKMLNPQ